MEEERDQSDFNSAVAYLNRLNTLFYVCDEAAMELNAFGWFHSLMTLFRELSTEMTDTEIDNFEKRSNAFNTLIVESDRKSDKSGKRVMSPSLYTGLHKFELDLRKIFKGAGLQQKMAEEAGKALK